MSSLDQFDFEPMDEDEFERLNERKFDNEIDFNYCPECAVPMTLSGCEYHCGICGRVAEYLVEVARERNDFGTNSIRIFTGANKGRFYNITNDYTKTQRKFILDQLKHNQSNYRGNSFPVDVLVAVADKYNVIQKLITEDQLNDAGEVIGKKKFVRRGNIKDEVLAGLIYFECVRIGLVRKKRDIAMFMNLRTYGFSRGEDILRNIQAEGKLDLPVDEEPMEGFIDRYLEALDLDEKLYSGFIIEIVNESEMRRLGMNSQISSKIVGVIWIIIVKCKLSITSQQLEIAADNTKKNTFIKFYKIVLENIGLFRDIFIRHDIPYK